jgi:hypothetical protein
LQICTIQLYISQDINRLSINTILIPSLLYFTRGVVEGLDVFDASLHLSFHHDNVLPLNCLGDVMVRWLPQVWYIVDLHPSQVKPKTDFVASPLSMQHLGAWINTENYARSEWPIFRLVSNCCLMPSEQFPVIPIREQVTSILQWYDVCLVLAQQA